VKARRGWTTVGRWVAVAAAAATLAGTATATATADQARQNNPFRYSCRELNTSYLPFAAGRHCQAFDGAPHEGPVMGGGGGFRGGGFRIESPQRAVLCTPPRDDHGPRPGHRSPIPQPRRLSGFALLPEGVVGLNCRRVK